jgi:hypothetical protein
MHSATNLDTSKKDMAGFRMIRPATTSKVSC